MNLYASQHRPNDARQLYVSLRSASVATRLEELVESRTSIEEQLERLGNALRTGSSPEVNRLNFAELEKNQRLYGEVVDTIERLESLLRASTATQSLDELNAEFDQLLAISQIAAIKPQQGSLVIVVCGQVEYNGSTYDTGDWEMTLPTKADSIDTRVLRRDYVRKGWDHERYPSYMYFGGFCFGVNRKPIEEYVETGQLLAAVQLAVHCICSVSPGDQIHIPRALRRINRSEAL